MEVKEISNIEEIKLTNEFYGVTVDGKIVNRFIINRDNINNYIIMALSKKEYNSINKIHTNLQKIKQETINKLNNKEISEDDKLNIESELEANIKNINETIIKLDDGFSFKIKEILVYGVLDLDNPDTIGVMKKILDSNKDRIIPSNYNYEYHKHSLLFEHNRDIKKCCTYYHGVLGKPDNILIVRINTEKHKRMAHEIRRSKKGSII